VRVGWCGSGAVLDVESSGVVWPCGGLVWSWF